MPPDDVLRLRATVVSEEALANIRAIGREIGLVPSKAGKGVQQVNSSFAELGKTIKGVGSELKAAVPSLGAFGLGAAGVGIAARTLIGSLGDISAKIVQMKYASKELGMTEQALRGFSEAAQKAGIAPEAMTAGLQSFKRNTEDIKNRMGELRGELYAMGAGDFVNRVKNSAEQIDALKEAFDFKEALNKSDPSGVKARRFFEMIGLGASAARLSWDELSETIKNKKVLSDEDKKLAKDFNDQLVKLGETWDQLTTKVGIRLFPVVGKDLEDIQRILDKLEKLDTWVDGWTGKGTSKDPMAALVEKTLPSWMHFNLFGNNPAKDGAGNVIPPAPALPTPSELNARPRRGTSGFKPISFGGFGDDGGEQSSASRLVQTGVFDALVQFQSYAGTGGTGGVSPAAYHPGGGTGGPGGADNTPIGRAFRAAGQNGTGTTGGTDGGAPRNAQLNDEAGKPIDPATMKEAENLGRSGDTAGLQKLFAQKGYRMSGPACGIVASAYVKSAGFKPPPGGAIASNWNDWGQKTDEGDINKEGRPFGSMVASYQNRRYGGNVGAPLGKGQTGGHVMNIVPGTYDPKTGTAMFADQYGVRRRSLKGMDLRYAGDEAVAAAKAKGNAELPNGQQPPAAGGTPFQQARAAAVEAGIKDPDTAAAIAMYESGNMRRGKGGIFDRSGGTNPFGQTGVGSKGYIVGADGQKHKVYGSLAEGFEDHQRRWGGRYGDTPEETTRNLVQGGYNSENPAWSSNVMKIRKRETAKNRIDSANKPQSVNGNVNVTVNSNGTKADAKVNEAGDLYQGTTVKQHKQMQRTEDAGESLSI